MEIKGYTKTTHDEWKLDSNKDTLHIIRQYYDDNNMLCKEVLYFKKED